MNRAKPFLKWAGGKTQLLDSINSKLPYNKDFVYIEPFVGSGAVLFWVLNNYPNLKQVVINDINTDLINSYKTIKTDVKSLIPILQQWENDYHNLADRPELKKAYYYSKRTTFNNRISNQVTQTALFIFLNRTCFNGLYRVNKNNGFNVPIGSYKKPKICNANNLRAVSKVLEPVEILNGDFAATIDYATKNTFFYLDPPYKPLNGTSSFNSYAKDSFDDNEQIRLKQFSDKLELLGHKWILSNSDVKNTNPANNFFDDLYKEYNINRVLAKRSINANASKRGLLTELLITN